MTSGFSSTSLSASLEDELSESESESESDSDSEAEENKASRVPLPPAADTSESSSEDESSDDSDEDADSPYSQLGRWAQENREVGPVEVYKKAEELGIAKKHKAVQVIAQTLFDEDIVKQIPANAPLFKKVSCSSYCLFCAAS